MTGTYLLRIPAIRGACPEFLSASLTGGIATHHLHTEYQSAVRISSGAPGTGSRSWFSATVTPTARSVIASRSIGPGSTCCMSRLAHSPWTRWPGKPAPPPGTWPAHSAPQSACPCSATTPSSAWRMPAASWARAARPSRSRTNVGSRISRTSLADSSRATDSRREPFRAWWYRRLTVKKPCWHVSRAPGWLPRTNRTA